MAKLKVFYGSMRAGKSTLALQMKENFDLIDEQSLLMSTIENEVSSRVGLSKTAVFISKEDNIQHRLHHSIQHIIIDEAQFITSDQAQQLANLVDTEDVNVYCFGLLTDYRGKLFNGTKALLELADEVEEIQAKSLCWCGRKATHNMRIDEDGYPYTEGDIVGIGEGYEVLCRQHFNEGKTKQVKLDIEGDV